MGTIIQETEDYTLLEKLAREAPEIIDEFEPLFIEKVDIHIPEVLLLDKISDFNAKLGFNLGIDAISSRESRKVNSFLLKLDELLDLYKQEWSLSRKNIPDILMRTVKNGDGIRSAPSFIANFNIVSGHNDVNRLFSVFDAVINREASYGNGSYGLQKLEGIVDVRDLSNKNRFTQLTINEISREKDDDEIGHYLVSCKNSISERVGHHVWLFPNKKRSLFRQIPGLFKQYILKNKSKVVPLFEWLETVCERDFSKANLDELGKYPERVCDDTEMIGKIMSRSEARHYKETIGEILQRIETMYVPKDIARDIEIDPANDLQGESIVLPNVDLDERSFGLIKELDIKKLKDCIGKNYRGEEFNNRFTDNGDLKFSELYYKDKSGCKDPQKREYSVFQLYVHRHSSSFEGEKFESFLEVLNTHNPDNRFVLKIEELRKYGARGVYAVELFTNGNKIEHHLQVIEADRDVAIDLPRSVREILRQNGYKSAPEYIHIYNKLKSS